MSSEPATKADANVNFYLTCALITLQVLVLLAAIFHVGNAVDRVEKTQR